MQENGLKGNGRNLNFVDVEGDMILFDLFSGIGGFHLALKQAGVNNVKSYFSEVNKYAIQIYKKQFPDSIAIGDISRVDVSGLPRPDLVTFGWPCQDNSIAGKRAGQTSGTRSGLLTHAVEIIKTKRPRYFVAENVPGLFSVGNGTQFYETLRLFSDVGYDCQWQLCDTAWVLPQSRKRIFFVGHIRGERRPQVFPIGEDIEKIKFFNPKKTKHVAQCLRSRDYANWNGNFVQQIGKIGKGGMAERIYNTNCSTTIKANGGGRGAKTGLYKINERIRKLTPVECERLQGYPDNWTEGESDNQRYKCLGNSITVNVAECIFRKLLTW